MSSSPPLALTTLFFGGTFDPVHHGHLLIARSAAEALGFDRVALIPAAQSPHKLRYTTPSTPSHRQSMLELVCQDDPFFTLLTLELERPPPSYTYDTVHQLFQQGWGNPESSLTWLIGADQLHALPRWHRATELIRLARLAIAARPGWSFDFSSLPPEFHHLEHNIVQAPTIDISSTDIRQRVRAGLSISYLVPPKVEQYIHDHQLYR